MHQIYLAVRAILYFDGNLSAGLAEGTKMTLVGLGVGLLIGVVVTWIYDRRGFHRLEDAPATTRVLGSVKIG
jgi:hypothetical protein